MFGWMGLRSALNTGGVVGLARQSKLQGDGSIFAPCRADVCEGLPGFIS